MMPVTWLRLSDCSVEEDVILRVLTICGVWADRQRIVTVSQLYQTFKISKGMAGKIVNRSSWKQWCRTYMADCLGPPWKRRGTGRWVHRAIGLVIMVEPWRRVIGLLVVGRRRRRWSAPWQSQNSQWSPEPNKCRRGSHCNLWLRFGNWWRHGGRLERSCTASCSLGRRSMMENRQRRKRAPEAMRGSLRWPSGNAFCGVEQNRLQMIEWANLSTYKQICSSRFGCLWMSIRWERPHIYVQSEEMCCRSDSMSASNLLPPRPASGEWLLDGR